MSDNLNYEQLSSEYNLLMNVLEVSVSKHLADEHFTCIWANDYYYQMIRYSKEEYEARFHNHPDEFFANPVDVVLITAPGYTDEIAGIIRERFGSDVEICAMRTNRVEWL